MSFVCADLTHISRYAAVSDFAYKILKRFLPGPYTFVLKAAPGSPKRLLHETRKTIGLRVPDHSITQALLTSLGEPLLSCTLMLPDDELPISDPDQARALHAVGVQVESGLRSFLMQGNQQAIISNTPLLKLFKKYHSAT